MNNELDIKPGQVWVRRDGGQARIYAIDGMGLYSIQGASKVKDGWRSTSWDASGNFYPIETDFDLIRLYDWRDELAPIWAVLDPRFAYCAMESDREWWCFERRIKEYTPIDGKWYMGGARRRMDFIKMPNPDCPWHETLTMRPGEGNTL